MAFHDPLFMTLLMICFMIFWLSKGPWRLYILAILDALFYMCAGLVHFTVLLVAALMTFIGGLGMRGRHRRIWLFAALGVNVINLVFFKYTGFILHNVEFLFPLPREWLAAKIVLPIGISFYTFQLISYLLDVNAERLKPCTSWLTFWVYISFFAQVIAGPIMRGQDFLPQVQNTEKFSFDASSIRSGALLILLGLFKKLVIADTLAPLVDGLFADPLSLSSVDNWIAGYVFAFQIYYDFSAYSDIALGIGRLFGYRLTQNFRCPYLSSNPSEFWKRWHITLSTWVRDYLYIPMGGSRKGFVRGCLAAVIAMAISGLWHGAAWTFVVWGIYHGVLVVIYRVLHLLVKGGRYARRSEMGIKENDKPTFIPNVRYVTKMASIAGILVFFNLTVIGWVMFRAGSTATMVGMLRKMVTLEDLSYGPHVMQYALAILGLYLAHIAEYVVRFDPKRASSVQDWWGKKVPSSVKGLVYALAITTVLVFLRPKENAFIYFQF